MSQKAENLLNLALDATSEEREKSLELEVGYQPLDQEWDLIIKIFGKSGGGFVKSPLLLRNYRMSMQF